MSGTGMMYGVTNSAFQGMDPYQAQQVVQSLQQNQARQKLVQSMMQPPPQQAAGGWGGLANAGSMIAGAAALKGVQNQMNDPNYSTDLARYGMTPQDIQSAANPGMGSAVGQWLKNALGGGGS